jgi:hypothetical protein
MTSLPFPPAARSAAQVLPVGGATCRGVDPVSASVLSFVDTWVSAPHRPGPIARDFTFKAVIGEPDF